MQFSSDSGTRIFAVIVFYICSPLCFAQNRTVSENELKDFCIERFGVLSANEEICIYETSVAVSSWHDARQQCRFPDQHENADLFYMGDESEAKFILEKLLREGGKEKLSSKWWTAAVKVLRKPGIPRIIWRNSDVPEWLSDYAVGLTSDNDIEFMSLEVGLSGTDKISIKFKSTSDKDVPTPLCRYSPNNGNIDDGATTTSSTAKTTANPSTKPATITTIEVTAPHTVSPVTITTGEQPSSPHHDTRCPATTVDDVHWDSVDRESYGENKCPDGYNGTAKWYCPNIGERNPRDINYNNCKMKWINDIMDDFNSTAEAIESFENASRDNPLLNEESVEKANKAMDDLLEQFEEELGTDMEIDVSEQVKNFVTSVLNTWNNMLNDTKNVAWENLPPDKSALHAERAMENVERCGRLYGCRSANGTTSQSIESKDITLVAFDVKKEKNLQFSSTSQTSIVVNQELEKYIPQHEKECSNKKIVVGVVYANMGKKLTKNYSEIEGISEIIGLVVRPNKSIALDGYNVHISIRNVKKNHDAKCVFWDVYRKNWSSEGCRTVISKKGSAECKCNHLTNFAFLMFAKEKPIESKALKYITIVSCGLSSVALVLTILCLGGFRTLRCRRTTITCNLCAALLMVNLLVLFGMDRDQFGEDTPLPLCFAVAVALHVFLISAFMWMMMEAYLLYQMIVVVFTEVLNIRVAWFYLLGYGIPLMVTGISIGSRPNSYLSDSKYCWIDNDNHGMIWSFLGPAYLIMFINICVFVCAMKAAAEVKNKKNFHSTQALATSWLKRSFNISCLLGITWTLGVFQEYEPKVFPFIFTILNGLQGVFIFIFHVALNEKARSAILKYYKQHKTSHVGVSTIADKTTRVRAFTGGSFLSSNLRSGFTKSTRVGSLGSSLSSNKRTSNSSLESQLSSRVQYT